jgi:putative transposase
MIGFIDEYREAHGVEPICKVLPIAPSTYHDHIAKRRDPSRLSARAKKDVALKPEITRVFKENFEVYGVRKVWRQLKREGRDVARCTVERLMQSMGLHGVIRGRLVRTTFSDKTAPCPLDHVNRQFHAPAPNRLWVSDFTYVSTWNGFVYVAFVIDVYARYIVGWRVSRTAHAGFVLDALEGLSAISFITATAAVSIFRSSTRNAWRRPALNHPSAVSVTATTTRSLRPSTASTKPK